MQVPFRLDGKKALITGGASGIGEAMCQVFANAGASVFVADRDKSRCESVASNLPNATACVLDITNETEVRQTVGNLDQLDILVNNAGIGHVGGIEDTEIHDLTSLWNVNVGGTFLVTKYAVPHLIASRGNVINIGSVAGLVGIRKRFAYSATKGAVVAMSRQLAIEYAQQFRVNCICPGTVDSPFVESYLEKFHKGEKDTVREQIKQRQPLGRLGTPVEIAHLALYMTSNEAGYMTGSIVTIDGGWTAA